jgi:CheY-like chemotaxis protein
MGFIHKDLFRTADTVLQEAGHPALGRNMTKEEKTKDEKAVLCVDDESSILTALTRLLRKEPYRVFTAPGGAAGLEILDQQDVQVVITDQRMPEMTGTQFLQKVKAKKPDTIRVVLSGYAEAEAIVAAINQGEVYRFVAKPWQDEPLKSTIRQCFDQYDLLQENLRLTEQTRLQVGQLQNLNRLLEASVDIRTRSLQFSQEVLDHLPVAVVGISLEQEIILTNAAAMAQLEPLASLVPGTDMAAVLPPDAVSGVCACLTTACAEPFTFDWDGRRWIAHPSNLGVGDGRRGCVLLLEEVGS